MASDRYKPENDHSNAQNDTPAGERQVVFRHQVSAVSNMSAILLT